MPSCFILSLLFTYLSLAPRRLLPKASLALSSLKMKRVSSSFGTRHCSRRAYRFFCGLDVARGRGGLISPVLGVHARGGTCSGYPQRILTLGTKIALWCPRPWRGLYNSTESSMECLKHQGNLALISLRLVPTLEERPTTAAPFRPQGV